MLNKHKMDLDLEIISEEGRSPDPLFSSIINAMNSMKEATADKIYQKIQREGSTNYSKPQVDRALACALKYGIFEVKNNRYRVRDDVLDDIDTVYWKMQKKREQTPFRVQDSLNERHLGQKLDPEKDNLRFKKITDPEGSECPQCGRTKRPSPDKRDDLRVKKEKKDKSRNNKEPAKSQKKRRSKNVQNNEEKDEIFAELPGEYSKRKLRSSSLSSSKNTKLRRLAEEETDSLNMGDQTYYFMPGGGKYDTTDESELDSLSLFSDDEQSFGSFQGKNNPMQRSDKLCRFDSECEDALPKDENENAGTTSPSISRYSLKTDNQSEGNMSPVPNESFRGNFSRNICNDAPYTSKDESLYFNENKSYGREETNECNKKSDWMDYSGDANGTVIQRNNVLTIEPMDSMAFKGPEHTSYIS